MVAQRRLRRQPRSSNGNCCDYWYRSGVGLIVFFQILRRSGATNAVLVTLLIPVTTILVGYLVLGESISPRESWVRS